MGSLMGRALTVEGTDNHIYGLQYLGIEEEDEELDPDMAKVQKRLKVSPQFSILHSSPTPGPHLKGEWHVDDFEGRCTSTCLPRSFWRL